MKKLTLVVLEWSGTIREIKWKLNDNLIVMEWND